MTITAPTLSTKNQVTNISGKPTGTRNGCRIALTIRSPTKPRIQHAACRGSSRRRATSGHNAAHMMTALEFLNPPRLIINSHGRIKNVRSLNEAIEDEIAIPCKDRRIDRGDDHIQARNGSRERCASGEVDYAPQQSQRQESKRQRNNQPFLQRYFGAVGGSDLPPLERLCRNLLHA